MAKSIAQEFTKGLWAEIPPFRLVLGLCPVLAVTKTVENGIGMGLATTFVLVCSNILVSSLRTVIPAKVRIACFIIIIATFVTVVELVMQAFAMGQQPEEWQEVGRGEADSEQCRHRRCLYPGKFHCRHRRLRNHGQSMARRDPGSGHYRSRWACRTILGRVHEGGKAGGHGST